MTGLGYERTVDETVNQHIGHKPQPVGEAFLTLLERDHMRLLRLCAGLEKIADGLPGTGHQIRTGKVLSFLDKAFARHLFLHEKCLFPLVRSLEEKNEPVEVMLRELEFEHSADRGLIVEILSAYMGRDSRNAVASCERCTPSLRYTCCRWFSTVRTDTASWSAISRFVLPAAAS